MTATIARHTGWLHRQGRLWKIPVFETDDFLGPGDELFVGDRLSFPEMRSNRNLLLRVVFSRAQYLYGQYQLVAAVHCPACGCSAVHDVTVAASHHPPAGYVWTFQRTCRECQHAWPQEGQQPHYQMSQTEGRP